MIRRRGTYGFTLVELLVVIAIIGVLVALALPAMTAVRHSAHNTQCKNNLKQLALAALAHDEAKGRLPKFWDDPNVVKDTINDNDPSSPRTGTDVLGNWFVQLLPYLDQAALYEEIIATGPKGGYSQADIPPSPDYQPRTGGAPIADKECEKGQTTKVEYPPPPPPPPPSTTVEQKRGHDYEFPPPPAPAPPKPIVTKDPPCPPTGYTPVIPQKGTPGKKGAKIYKGIDLFSHVVFEVMQCPGDPSFNGSYLTKAPTKSPPFRYVTDNRLWSIGNYLANWHAFSSVSGDVKKENIPYPSKFAPDNRTPRFAPGQYVLPTSIGRITDGSSQTILFSEAYAHCDLVDRIAMWGETAWFHNNQRQASSYPSASFGLNWQVWEDPAKFNFSGRVGSKNATTPANTYMFQMQPRLDQCVDVRIQASHSGGLNVAMGDGSVRSLSPEISRQEISDPIKTAKVGGLPDPVDMNAGKLDAGGQPIASNDYGYGVWDRMLMPRDGLELSLPE